MHCDFDDSLEQPAEPPRKKGKAGHGQALPCGPLHADCDNWVDSTLKLLQQHGLQFFGVDFLQRFSAFMQPGKGISVRIDYSGLSGPEEACYQMAKAMRLDKSVIACHRACELTLEGQLLLMNREQSWRDVDGFDTNFFVFLT